MLFCIPVLNIISRRIEMAKRIILYNLAEHVTEEEFRDYANKEKGPLIKSLPSVINYELVKISSDARSNFPYDYMGIVHLTSLEEYEQLAMTTQAYQDFLKKFVPMVKDLHTITGEEIFP
jgi:hypothetical protein